jgi:flagellar biosynthesis protein FlhG
MLTAPDQADGIRVARQRSEPVGRSRGTLLATSRTIAITSGKGGVGKTQLSANLAVALARRGQRVLLLDADLGLASLDLVLGVQPTADLLAVVRGQCAIRDILVGGPAGVQLVPACPGRYEMANLASAERERLLMVLRDLASSFDVLIIDTGAGIGANSVGFATLADEIVLVATPEPTSLRDAYAMAKVLHRRCGVEHIDVVANQVSGEADGRDVFERLRGIARRFLTLELGYLGCVPRDESVLRAVAMGEPCVLGAPRSQAARAFEHLARRIHANETSTPDIVC